MVPSSAARFQWAWRDAPSQFADMMEKVCAPRGHEGRPEDAAWAPGKRAQEGPCEDGHIFAVILGKLAILAGRNRRESAWRAPMRDVANRLAAAERRRHQRREDGRTFAVILGKLAIFAREGIVGSRHDAHRRGMSQAGLPPRGVGAASNAKMATLSRSSWESWPTWHEITNRIRFTARLPPPAASSVRD